VTRRKERPHHALVVDDAPTVRLYHGEILRRCGFAVDEAVNGYQALELALSTRYDLVLVDVNMPQMDGNTLVRRLREPPVEAACPIVTIATESGGARRSEDASAAYGSGSNLFLVKPVAPEHLEEVVRVLTGAAVAPEVAA
jgi:two-component system chemotaxis response regulator CheY